MKTLLLITGLMLSLCSHSQQQPYFRGFMHYYYNSGWLVTTPKHTIVFDFIPHAESKITIDKLKSQLQSLHSLGTKILVMVSHDHQDHWDPEILKLSESIPDIEFILGWKYETSLPNVKTLNAGDSIIHQDYTVYTHAATDDGVGFLLNIDGLSIYHGGDHALWAEQIVQPFTDELKKIRSKTDSIHLALLPAARGMFTKCAYDSVIEKGILLSLEILQPGTVGLMHVGCKDKLSHYTTAQKAAMKKYKARLWVVPGRFDRAFTPKEY